MTKYTAEETAANRQKWVDALRSGEYEQGDSYLRFGNKFCCLGVACEVAIQNGVDLLVEPQYLDEESRYDGMDTQLPRAVTEWLGLKEGAGPLVQPRPVDDWGSHDNLWHLNDRAKLSFEEIADVIESGGVQLSDD